MRELKFNAVIDGKYISDTSRVETEIALRGLKQTDSFQLLQFTGLHDKDGKEIYADNIVSAEIEQTIGDNIIVNGVVEWDSSGWWCIDFPQLGQGIGIAGAVEMSVIGNYHENADLLDDK